MKDMNSIARGFDTGEFRARVARAQERMARANLSAILLTTEPDVRYFTGYLTRFWESPSRPWYLVVPERGDPIAVIPSIGAALMGKTWINDIRTWAAPHPIDDGISLLTDCLVEVAGGGGRVGLPTGAESHLRMPLSDFGRVQAGVQAKGVVFGDDAGIMRHLRQVKSEAEIDKIRHTCSIAGRAFARVPEIARAGEPLDQVFRGFQALLLAEGADWVPYVAGGAGPEGYGDVISPASEVPLRHGDVLMLDTGAVWDGYFCDYDRNFTIGRPSMLLRAGYARLMEAAEAGLATAKVGARASDVFRAMADVVGKGETAGRLGHGLGMQLTEGLSLTEGDHTVLEEGMVITLEPGLEIANGNFLVHEENIVIREGEAEILSPWAGTEMMQI